MLVSTHLDRLTDYSDRQVLNLLYMAISDETTDWLSYSKITSEISRRFPDGISDQEEREIKEALAAKAKRLENLISDTFKENAASQVWGKAWSLQ